MKLTENQLRHIIKKIINEQFKPNFPLEDRLIQKSIVRITDPNLIQFGINYPVIDLLSSMKKFKLFHLEETGEDPDGFVMSYVKEKLQNMK